MPSTSSLVTDYRVVTEACGLLDRSERGKLALSGAEAAVFLQGQVSNDVESLTPGRGCYAAFLTPKGKMLGDLRILATEDELLLDTERSSLQELFNMIRRFSIGYEAVLHKRTLERGLLSLVGPGSDAVAGVAGRLSSVEHSHQQVTIGGVRARAIRTDLGVDLLAEAESTDALRAALAAAGAEAVAEEAAECLRIEHGRPRYGIDLDDSVIPQEAGLNSRAVSFTKGCYVGQETVARLFYRGKPNRHLRGLGSATVLEPGAVLLAGEREVGRVTSAVDSPRLGPIALGFVRREVDPGTVVHVGPDGLEAEIVELPFGGTDEVA